MNNRTNPAWDVTCPRCGAAEGQPCTGLLTGERVAFHAGRKALARGARPSERDRRWLAWLADARAVLPVRAGQTERLRLDDSRDPRAGRGWRRIVEGPVRVKGCDEVRRTTQRFGSPTLVCEQRQIGEWGDVEWVTLHPTVEASAPTTATIK